MSTDVYNPFPTVNPPLWFNSGVCYATAWYDNKPDALDAQKLQQAKHGHVNGGYMDGEPLGMLIQATQEDGSVHWGVTC